MSFGHFGSCQSQKPRLRESSLWDCCIENLHASWLFELHNAEHVFFLFGGADHSVPSSVASLCRSNASSSPCFLSADVPCSWQISCVGVRFKARHFWHSLGSRVLQRFSL